MWRTLALLVAAALFAGIVYRWISLERLLHLAPEIAATPTPEPSPTRPPVITGKVDTGKLFNGITLHSAIETKPGADATTERSDPDSYVIDLKLELLGTLADPIFQFLVCVVELAITLFHLGEERVEAVGEHPDLVV